MNNMNNISSHKIRNMPNFKHLKDDSEHLLNKLKELTRDELVKFKDLCDHLVVGLRDRYSGDQDYNSNKKINWFSTSPTKANLNINFEGVKSMLQDISLTFRDYDVHLLLSLCTHRHATFSKVEKYPTKLKAILDKMNLNTNSTYLLFIKNNISYNDKTFFALANKQFFNKDLKNCEFNRISCKNSLFINCNFYQAKLKQSNFKNSCFNCSNFEDADLYNSNFYNCSFKKCDFTDCNLEEAFFEGADFENATVEKKWYSGLVDMNIKNFNTIIWI